MDVPASLGVTNHNADVTARWWE